MAQTDRLALLAARRRRRTVLKWVAVVCVAAAVLEVGAVTNVFGLGPLFRKSSSTSSTGPNPNPYDENVTALFGAIVYSGSGNDPFPSLNGGELCVKCPITPKTDTNVSPPVASVWIYFNITYTGSSDVTIANFTLTSSGSNPALFQLLGVFAPPVFGETVTTVTFWPSHATWELAIHASAASIPYDGSTGYQLTFHVTSP